MFIREFEYSPTSDEQEILDFIASDRFPLYWQKSSSPNSTKYMQYAHALMVRNSEGLPKEGTINSTHFEKIKNFFLKVCSSDGIQVNTVLRAAVNNVPHYPDETSDIHVDHDFPHFNFIYHVNDTRSPTNLYDENHKLIFQSSPRKNHVTIFSGIPHAAVWPKPYEQRIVLVFTFLGEIE